MSEAHDRALQRLPDFVEQYDDFDSFPRDLLADLMHWCSHYGINFNKELRVAYDNYLSEIEDAESPQD